MIEERQAVDYARRRADGSGRATPGVALRLRAALFHGGLLLLYALLAVVVSWPMARSFTTAVIGAEGAVDAYQCAWNLWWVADALSRGRSPFFTPLLFYPYGVDLFWQTLQFSQAVAALPVTLLFGPLAGFNWTVLGGFVIGGYVTFLFARRVVGHVPGAIVAGAVFAFSPYHMQKVVDGGLEVSSIQWLPCYFFALYLLLERPGWWRSLLCGALLLWVSLGSWYYGLFAVLATGCAALVWLLFPAGAYALRPPPRERWLVAAWGLSPVLWWGLAILPRLAALVAEPDALFDMRAIQARRSADLMDFFLPNPLHPLWGAAVRAAREQLYPEAIIWNVSLGWVGLALGALGAVAMWRQARPWVALLGLLLLLALGPSLRVFGADTGLPLPFALLQDLPGFRANQRPNHIVVIASLMLAILAAYGVAWLAGRLARPGGAALAAAAVGLILAVDAYAGPMTLVSRPLHPFYASLPPPPAGPAALMPLPLYVNINRSENLTPQMAHRWPILGGYIARPPAYDFARYTPGVRELEGASPVPDDIVAPGWPDLGRRGLAAYGIRYVTFDLSSGKDDYFARVRSHIDQLQLGPPIFADAALEVYAVPQTWVPAPLGFLGPGWNDLERQAPYRWRWMGEQAELRLFNPLNRPVLATVALSVASYQQPRPLEVRLGAASLARLNVDAAGPQTHRLTFLLLPGEHTLHFAAPAAPDPQRAGAAISVRLFQLELRFAEPELSP